MPWKKLFIFLVFLNILQPGFPQGIIFLNLEFESALALAHQHKKGIFIDVYTTWCGPCRWMDQNVFNDKDVGNLINTNFIALKVDAEGPGSSVARRFAVRAYPTYLFLDNTGKLITEVRGAKPMQTFIRLVHGVLGESEEMQAMQERYKNGDRDTTFLRAYFNALKASFHPQYGVQVRKYLKSQADMLTPFNMEVAFHHCLTDVHCREFEFLIHNRRAFNIRFGAAEVDIRIRMLLQEELLNSDQEHKVLKLYQNYFPADGQQFFHEDKLAWLLSSSADVELISREAHLCFDQGECRNWTILNDAVFRLAILSQSEMTLQTLRSWIEQSTALNKNSTNMDTYSVVLYKLGEKDAALRAVQEANELAFREGVPFKSSIRLLRILSQ